METSGVGSGGAVMGMLARNADEDVAKSALLMKKALQADKDMVSKLLPVQGLVDIRA
jgi:hypothetical protein